MRTAMVVVTLVAAVLSAAADEAPWSPVKIAVGPFGGSVELAGYFEGFEHPLDERATVYGHTLVAAKDGASWTLSVDGGPPRRVSGTLIVPLGKGAEAREVQVVARGNALVWSSHWGARFKLGTHEFLLVDADADGVLGEQQAEGQQADGIVGPLSRTAAPFLGWAWAEDGAWELRGDARALESRAGGLPRQAPVTHDINRAWLLFNAWRMAAGCGSVRWNEQMARGCRAHADYAERNASRQFKEDPDKPGYSDEGDEAARSAIMSFIYEFAYEAMLEYLSTAYNTSCVLTPELRECGLAISGRTFCANVNADKSGESHPGPVIWVWPPHGAKDIVVGFNDNGEVPMPVPGKELEHELPIGHAVMAQVAEGGKRFTLELCTDKGEAIEGTLTCPDGPAPDHPGVGEDNKSLVILAPNKHLPRNTRFIATLRFETDDERVVEQVWTFATGGKDHNVL